MNQEWHYEEGMSAVDFLLANNPTEFQLQLLNLGRRFHWDENDPGFAVPLVVCRIDRVLDVYPEKIRREMEEITQRLEGRWKRMEVALNEAAARGTQAGERANDYLAEAQAVFELGIARAQDVLADERQAMALAMAQEREHMQKLLTREREEATRQIMAIAEQQKRLLEAHTKDLTEQAVVANQKRMDQQVKQIVKGVRMKHFWETIAVAMLAAMSILVVGWSAGLFLGRQPQLASQLELLSQHAGIQQQETGWLLEKANRAECFYGIKSQSDPQCQ
ncbi:hypothetical protein [cf. Phormidesmis sp. LEGE 11477]|uniref:hypothetical protein n=1 Tax=cf. Phormidesmis sp. LEGE 11477 TaxID=1828680 RepID=UPI001880BA2B|nr:hypothetical protein [cf. Phormidesmis sp. LEGE 11477]MBE9063189.1 hypothetical protein [cf. Phormidesmis sp. LEGE 11477]